VVGVAACDLLTCGPGVVTAGEAMLMAITVEAIGITTPAVRTGLVADEFRIV